MYVCMYIDVSLSIYNYIYIYTYVCIQYIYIYTYIYIYIYIHIFIHTPAGWTSRRWAATWAQAPARRWRRVLLYPYISLSLYIYIYMYIHVLHLSLSLSLFLSIFIYIYIYTHTHSCLSILVGALLARKPLSCRSLTTNTFSCIGEKALRCSRAQGFSHQQSSNHNYSKCLV